MRTDTRTDHEKYLEYELENEREERRRESERQEADRQRRRKENQEEMESRYREADTWPEAFQKQASLCWREHNQYPDSDDDFFKLSAQANEKALELWNEVTAGKQAELDALQAQIDAVWNSIRGEVADKLVAISDSSGYSSTAQAIRDNNLDRYLDW